MMGGYKRSINPRQIEGRPMSALKGAEMRAVAKKQDAPLAKELERLQQEFQRQHPEIAEALRVMNTSFEQYLAALGYLRASAIPVGASDHTTALP